MARQARAKSLSGYYHVITRGIGRQVLFEEDRDYEYFISLLKKYSLETNVSVCAYCLMNNHVHILLFDPDDAISLFMKKIGVSYSWFFNKKYERTGHLFQDRYRSEPIHDNAYLLTAFRYILQNPQKASICQTESYPWSSYHSYEDENSFVNTDMIRTLIGSFSDYEKFLSQNEDSECLEFEVRKRDDESSRQQLCLILDISDGMKLQSFDKTERDKALRKLKEEGFNPFQVARLTGLGRSTVRRIMLD